VAVTSDHGEEFLEHGTWEHGEGLNDNQLRVPLWVRAPGAATAGRRVSAVVSVMDILPTLLSITSLPVPPAVQGQDLSHMLEHSTLAPEEVFALSTSMLSQPTLHAVRSNRYRLLWDEATDAHQLFDLEADPSETRDVARLYPKVASQLREILLSDLNRFATDGSLDRVSAPIPLSLCERLRALGYVQ